MTAGNPGRVNAITQNASKCPVHSRIIKLRDARSLMSPGPVKAW